MNQNVFNPGDVVKLSSGGPSMTVSKIENGLVRCVWFNEALSRFENLRISGALLVKQPLFTQS